MKDKTRGDHPFTVFFSDHIRLRGVFDGHRLKIEYSLPFGFDRFRKLRLLFGREVFPGYFVGVPSTEEKILHTVCSPQPTQSNRFRVPGFFQRRGFVSPPLLSECSSFFHLWLASTVRVGHVASSFCSLPKALPRSCSGRVALQSGYHLQRLCSCVVARTSLLRKNEKGQRIHLSQLVSAFSHAVHPSNLDPKIRPDDVLEDLFLLEIEPCDHRLQSPCQCRLKSRLRHRAPRVFLIWYCVMGRWNWQVH